MRYEDLLEEDQIKVVTAFRKHVIIKKSKKSGFVFALAPILFLVFLFGLEIASGNNPMEILPVVLIVFGPLVVLFLFIAKNYFDSWRKARVSTSSITFEELKGIMNDELVLGVKFSEHNYKGVMKQVYNDWTSFFEGSKEFKINRSKFKGRPKPPRYKTKGTANSVVFSNQVCTVKDGKYIRFPKTKEVFNLSKHLKCKIENAKLVQVRAQKFYDDVKLEIVLDCSQNVEEMIPKKDVKNVMAIDLGVNNLATCVSSNGIQPTIINGKALESINQYYKKTIIS